MPSIQIQLSSTLDSEIKDHMNRFGHTSKNDFLIEVIISEWLADNKKVLDEFRNKYKEEKKQ